MSDEKEWCVDDILEEDADDTDALDEVESHVTRTSPPVASKDPKSYAPLTAVEIAANREEIGHLRNRLYAHNENCRDLFVDMTALNYVATADDSYVEFMDKAFYGKKLYFKVDPQNPRDPKVIIASKQFCKLIGIPYSFFAANRPSLKMNIVKTWQSGLVAQESKIQNILKIREADEFAIIRAFMPVTKGSIQLYELIDMILCLEIPVTMEFVYGDDKDEPILHARFLFEKEYTLFGTSVCLGFSMLASELDASPLVIDILLHDKVHATSYIASYGGDSFFKSKYEGIQAKQLRDVFPKILNRIDSETPAMLSCVERRVQASWDDGVFCAEAECMNLMRTKGFSGAIKKAVYHQITECQADIRTPWDIARHVGLVAKDFDSIKRIDIERGIGKYLQLVFAKE